MVLALVVLATSLAVYPHLFLDWVQSTAQALSLF
jgi:hypothetical protein